MNKVLKMRVMKAIKNFFSEYFVSVAQTQKELSLDIPFVCCHLRVYLDPHLVQGGLNKMRHLFGNVSWYIMREIHTALLHMLKHSRGLRNVWQGSSPQPTHAEACPWSL